jgi:hypothetical protein
LSAIAALDVTEPTLHQHDGRRELAEADAVAARDDAVLTADFAGAETSLTAAGCGGWGLLALHGVSGGRA